MTLLGRRWRGETVSREANGEDEPAYWTSFARRIEQREPDAEAELAHRFHARVRTMASVRLHGSDAAADIAQETILAVLEALRAGRLREPERLPAFVLSVARNLINSHIRTRVRDGALPHDPPDRPAEDRTGFDGLDDDRRVLVREALKRLDALDRRILLLTLVEGMTPREIAPLTGLEPDAVRSRKSRAVKAMRATIKKLSRKRSWIHIAMSGRRPWSS